MPLTRKLASKSLIKQNTNQDVFGTGVTNLVRDAFIGTGSQTVFNLTISPLSAANTQVFISGVYQNKDTYSISGNVLTFTSAPPNGTNIEVMSGTNYSIGVPGDGAVTTTKIANNNVTNAKLAQAPAYTIKANNTASTANSSDITVPQLAAMFTAPTIQTFTTSGSGTYTTPANVKYIKVKMVGSGGGGGGGGGVGIAGNPTTFGLATAGGAGASGAGGTGNLGGYSGFTISGGSSSASVQAGGGAAQLPGHAGGNSFFGGAGGAAQSAAANSGSGGGGSNGGGGFNGGGGGAGAYCEFIILNPSPTYSYSVGAGTTSATSGGSGIIIVEEYYQ